MSQTHQIELAESEVALFNIEPHLSQDAQHAKWLENAREVLRNRGIAGHPESVEAVGISPGAGHLPSTYYLTFTQ